MVAEIKIKQKTLLNDYKIVLQVLQASSIHLAPRRARESIEFHMGSGYSKVGQ